MAKIPPLNEVIRARKDWLPVKKSTVKVFDGKLAAKQGAAKHADTYSKLREIMGHMVESDMDEMRDIFMPGDTTGRAYARMVKVCDEGLSYVLPITVARYPHSVMNLAIVISERVNRYIDSQPHLMDNCPRITPDELIYINLHNAGEVNSAEALDLAIDYESDIPDQTYLTNGETKRLREGVADDA